MKIGDLICAIWSSRLAPSEYGKTIHNGIYLGSTQTGDHPADKHHKILSCEGVMKLPSWHWNIKVISESR